jgi:hypothetical protein
MDRPFAIAKGGAVFINSDHGLIHQSPEAIQRLRDHFNTVPRHDWFYAGAQRIVADLDVAERDASRQAEDLASALASRQLESV